MVLFKLGLIFKRDSGGLSTRGLVANSIGSYVKIIRGEVHHPFLISIFWREAYWVVTLVTQYHSNLPQNTGNSKEISVFTRSRDKNWWAR